MTTYARHALRHLPLAVMAAATTWLTMFSWRGFSTDWGAFLGPLLLIALTVSLGGVALRAAPMPGRGGASLHVLLVLAVVWVILGGSLVHPFASSHAIDLAVENGWVSAETNTAPVPATAPSIAPLMIVCGAGALLAVDVLACWLRRVPLAGLPLLAVYGAPVIGFDGAVSWLLFVIAAVGYLLMMFAQESTRVSRWGRPLGSTALVDPNGFGVRAGASRASAGTVGGVAVVLAVLLPAFIPTLKLDALNLFSAAGGSGAVSVVNPIASMRRDLHRGSNVRLLDVRTNNPDPSYLRLAVLTQFDGVEWTTGNRPIVSGQVAEGQMPLEQGLNGRVGEKLYHYTVTATDDFQSTWLPTQFPVTDIFAPGAWHYDLTTMDFFSGDSETNTSGITYRMTAAVPQLSPYSLSHAPPAPPEIQSTYLPLQHVPAQVHALAVRVTHGLTNPYQMALRLQNWFRFTGGFRYDLASQPGDGKNALVDFLTPGHGGRVGYCEQFASAYAVMARSLDIPARVAVGFLQPTRAATGDWIYRAHDLHAWPELYFQGSGWVRFEPTPPIRARVPPPWAPPPRKHPVTPAAPTARASGSVPSRPTAGATPPRATGPSLRTSTAPSGPGVPWVALDETLGGLVVLGGLALVPGAVRRSRRARRLAGGAEDAWTELRDTAVDLGVEWSGGRTPRETGARLSRWFGAETDGPPPARPARGHGLAPDAEQALNRIVLTLEQVRYARSANDAKGALASDVLACVEALERGCTRAVLVRSRWLPRSVLARSGTVGRVVDREPDAVSPGGPLDHVG